jgi:hypothetical protein
MLTGMMLFTLLLKIFATSLCISFVLNSSDRREVALFAILSLCCVFCVVVDCLAILKFNPTWVQL